MKHRRFVNLPLNTQKILRAQYKDAYEALEYMYDTGVLKGIEQVSVSVFDHWLSFDEAIAQLSDIDVSIQYEYNRKLHTFACLLSNSFECYLVKHKGRYSNNVTYRKFSSDKAREDTLWPLDYRVPTRHRFELIIPELDAIYYEDDDFTHHIYFAKGNKSHKFTELLKKSDLHLL